MQCNEEIDDDSASISSKRPPSFSEGRPTKRMRATKLPAVKVSSVSHLLLFLAPPVSGLVCCQAGLKVIAWVHAFGTISCVWDNPNRRKDLAAAGQSVLCCCECLENVVWESTCRCHFQFVTQEGAGGRYLQHCVQDASPLPRWDILSFTLMCA